MNTEQMHVVVPPELKKEAEALAKQLNISRNALIRMALTEWIKNHK